MRMGKGKGSFDHWAARVAVNQVVFEIRGNLHEQVIRDAFRLAGNKLPGTSVRNLSCHIAAGGIAANSNVGQWEVVKKGDAPVVGITKLDGITLEDLKRPRKKLAVLDPASAAAAAATTSSSAPPPA